MAPMYLPQHVQTIEIAKKSVARVILHADIMTPSQQIFQELGWLPFPKRLKYHTCVMVFKARNGQAPEYLSVLLIKSEQIKNLRSNDKEILKVPFSKTAYYDRSFSVNGAKIVELTTTLFATIDRHKYILSTSGIFWSKTPMT